MKTLSTCAECGMPVIMGEYHPYTACVLYRQSEKVTDLLLDVVRYGYDAAQKGVSLKDAMRNIAATNKVARRKKPMPQ